MNEEQPKTEEGIERPHRRNRWASVLLCCVLFGSGIVCGSGLTLVVINRHLRRVVVHPELAVKGFVRVLVRRLDLDAAQQKQIRKIIAKRQLVLRHLRRTYQPQIEAELARLSTEIERVLRPEQQVIWGQMVQHMQGWRPSLPESEHETGARHDGERAE